MSDLILALPDWLPMLLTNVAALFVGLALFLLGFGLGGRRDGLDVRCRRCRHQYAFGQPIPANCSECGAATSSRGALALGVWRPRWRVIAAALASFLLAPAAVFIATSIPGWKDAATKAGGIDAAIDAAIANPQHMEFEQLHAFLQSDDGSPTDDAWLRFAERVEREPTVRTLAPQYLDHVAQWHANPSRPPTASDGTLESVGRAIARALRTDPSMAAKFPRMYRMDGFPAVVLDAIVADPEAMRAFLRGPVIESRFLPRTLGNDIRVRLVHDGIECLKRQFVFLSSEITYGRRDGTSRPLGVPQARGLALAGRRELDPTFGTEIALEAALADPEWDGTIRIDARVGHAGGGKFSQRSGGVDSSMLEGIVDHSWEIRVERIDPSKIRASPVNEPFANESVRNALDRLAVRCDAAADGTPRAGFDFDDFGTINGVWVELSAAIEQEGRTWPVVRGASNPLEGFEIGRPFALVLQGVPPKVVRSTEDFGYLAGRWTAKFDGNRRTPVEVVHTASPDAEAAPARSTGGGHSDRGRDRVVPGASVGPKRPIGTR